MSKTKKHAATLGGSADDIEAAFYEALQNADLEKLMACWADEDDLVCVHPSGPRLIGVAAIRSAFEASVPGRRRCARSSRSSAVCTICANASKY
jgi:ketosteroid isomerase-like protein